MWAWIFCAISSRERERVYFSLRTVWWIFVIFYQDTVVDFCLNTREYAGFGEGLRGRGRSFYFLANIRVFGKGWRGRGRSLYYLANIRVFGEGKRSRSVLYSQVRVDFFTCRGFSSLEEPFRSLFLKKIWKKRLAAKIMTPPKL